MGIFDDVSVGTPPSLDVGAQQLVDSIARAVLVKLRSEMKAPVVHVDGPTVNVPPAPALPRPEITINVPDQEGPEVVVDLGDLAAQQRETNRLLGALLAALERPVVRTVQRDGSGRITAVSERRG